MYWVFYLFELNSLFVIMSNFIPTPIPTFNLAEFIDWCCQNWNRHATEDYQRTIVDYVYRHVGEFAQLCNALVRMSRDYTPECSIGHFLLQIIYTVSMEQYHHMDYECFNTLNGVMEYVKRINGYCDLLRHYEEILFKEDMSAIETLEGLSF
jgi:hypothetical protein